jgi:protein SHQ1
MFAHSHTFPSLRLLTKRVDLLSPTQTKNVYLTLLTFLFAYAYDARTTQQDPTPESAWTICSLIPAFSALDPPPYSSSRLPTATVPISAASRNHGHPSSSSSANKDAFGSHEVAQVLATSYRRSLSFPLFRSWALAEACRRDIAELLCLGKRAIVRCLIEVKNVLDHHDVYYIYSKIWIDDILMWVAAYARSVPFCAIYILRPDKWG